MKQNNQSKTLVIFILILISLSCFTSADPYRDYINKPSSPASLPSSGLLSANINTGAAVYSYPIQVMPGTNGLQPGLSLSYSSLNSKSYPELVGSGWALTQSYIQRDTNDFPGDTSKHKFNLILSGASHELVYDSTDGRYHTKIESYLSIKKLSGGDNTKNEYWEVKTKDGTTYRFGYDSDSELMSNQHNYVWRWYLDQVTDTHDNNIYYSYLEDPSSGETGVTYIHKIEYNNDKKRRIEFGYVALPRSWTIFQGGQKITRKSRLTEIRIYYDNTMIRKYGIGYTNNNIATRTYISSITEYGKDGGSLPSTTFSYTNLEKGWERDRDIENKLPPAYFSYNNLDGGSRLIDINRDGMVDIVANFHHVWAGKYAFLNLFNGDFNRDDTFAPPAKFIDRYDTNIFFDMGVRLGDYNGDGYPDLIQGVYDEDADDEDYDIWTNTGNGWSLSSHDFVTKFVTIEDNSNNYKYVDEGVRLVDLNGDGYVDVLKAKQGQSKQAWINNQNGGWSSASNWNLPSNIYFIESDGDDEGVRLIDMNGDGLTDVYRSDDDYSKELWLNTGNGWEQTSSWPISNLPDNVDAGNDDEGIRFSDINGDGLADVLQGRETTRAAFINHGNNLVSDSSWDIPEFAEFVMNDGSNEGTRMVDINGDGSADIVRMKSNSGSITKLVWLNKANKQFLLDEVKNSAGAKHKIEYFNSGETENNKIGFNQWIVKSISLVDMLDHHDVNSNIDCVPASCPNGYDDKGIDCSGDDACVRICEIRSCGDWTKVMESTNPWSNYDLPQDAIGMPLFSTGFEDGKCYKVETSSDDNIVDESRIYDEDTSETDAVIVLYWEMSGLSEQPWGGDCGSDAHGLLRKNNHYLIDDKDSGNDYESADNIGGTWIGYCMPPEKGCSGYSTCTTECYGNTWRYSFYAIPDVEDGYEPGNPDDENGACKAQTTGPALNDYVDFKSGTSASMHVWKADMVVSGSSNQVCSKTPSIKTFYTYTGGYYDFGDKEFRGFGYVEELRPDNSKVKHYYHQDDSKKGMEYKTEMFDDKNRPYFKNENEASSTTTNGYHVVTLDSTKNYNYDGVAENPVITQTDYEYDDYGNVEKTSMLGEISVDDDERYSYTEYTYDTDKWILNIPTKTYLRSSDDSTKVSESYFEYNELGDLIRSESWLDTGENPVMTYGYDAYGNRVSETNARRKTTEYEYDSTHTFPIKTTNAKDQEMVFEYNLATGNVLSATDPNGYKTEYKYDQFGRKIKDILPYDTESKPTSEIVYNLDGNVPESVIVKQKQNDDMVSEQHYYYDGSGNVVQIKSDSSGSDHITKDFYYNLVGGLKWESNPYLMSSNSYSSPNSQVKKTNYEYDALGKVKKIINPDNTNVEIDRFRQLTSFFDENDHRIDYIEDLFGNVVNVREYNKGNIFDTYYTYDVVGNLIKINDSQGNEFDYNYDTLGRKTMMDDPDLGIWTYEYDASGNLVKQADNKGNQIELSYDELDRLKTKTVGSISESYRYDAGVVGTLSKIETNDIVKEFTYDQRLRIVEDKKTINGIDFVTTYTYDSADAVLSKTLPNGEIIDYTYDNVGNIKTVSDVVSDQQYNEDNQLVSRVYENALTSNYEYNPDNYKINRISTSDLQDLNYDLDAKNNIVIINDEIHDEQIDYEYDDLDRLTSATKTSQSDDEIIYDLGYYYDSIGNMLYFTSSEEEDDIDFIYEGSLAHAPSSVIFNSITTNRAPIVGIVEDITVDETDVVLLKFNVLDVPPAEGGGSIGGGPGGLSIESEHIIEVHDPDNDTLTYSVDNENFVQDQVDESLFRWETGYEDSDEYIIIVSASDGNFSDGRSFILTINNINREPRMDDVEDFWWEENQPIWMPFFAFDDDIEQDLEMTMVNGPEDAVFGNCEYSINESKETDKTQASCIFEWTPDYDSAGNHTIEFMLSDNDSQVTESFVIEVRDVNREPIINTKFRLSENFDNDLDTDFWDETTDHENWPFVDEHYVDLNKDVYHTAQLSPSNKVILLSMDHDFESGDIIEYEVNYLEGDGNILSRLTINNNPLDLMLGNVCNGHATCGNVGFWNGESAVGNIYGTYQVKLIFQNDSVNVNFINPNNEKFSYTSNEISPPFKFGVSTRTGHNGVGHIDYDNFKINSLSVDENELFLYKVDAEDPDDDTLTYALESDPIGMDIDSDGEITWQTDYENAGIYNLTVTVSDPYVSVIEEFALTINNINREPRMDDVEDFWWEENQPIWMPFFAFDDDDETDFEMSLVNGPQGAILHDCEYSINETKETGKTQAMCIFEWTPGYDDAGNYTIEFMLDDGDSQVTESFVIEVRDVNQDPIFDPIEDKSVEVGEELTVIISAKDYDKDSMDIASDFDKLIPFVSGTGSGSPADYSTISQTYKWSPNNQDYGIHNATFTVTDSKGGEDTESMLITVEGCIEDWLCGDWTECENSSQTRACFDFNKCGTIENKPEEEQECCVEDWECGSWNDCIDGLQTRTCTDDNQCGTIEHKPVAEQTCCAEDWECGDWSVCVDSLQTRTCTDNNLCGTIDDKPIEEQSCCAEYWNCTAWSDCVDSLQTRICTDDNLCGTIEDKPEQEQECCAEDWTCGSWGECIDSLQSRTCTDNNQCGTIVDKPDTSQECCVEDWDCSVWSDCENSSQMRVCVDFSNCGTIEDKPITEQECEMPCIEDWSCGDWSECDDSLQSRICTDDNQCGTIEQKPEEEQECEMPCIEEWQCGNWTICDNEEQNRTCLDINNCGTIEDKPEEEQECEMPCIEDWTCGNWSECDDSLQSRICTDDNQCGTIEDKPKEEQACEMPCVEDWECSVWSDCIDSLQTRTCIDFSNCDTIEDKPITEQACEMPCVEDWTCGNWTECDDSLQSRTCTDNNVCGTTDNKPKEEQACEMPCIEDWTCGDWSECNNSLQSRTCTDNNVCGTIDDKPEEEQECEMPCIEEWQCGNWTICDNEEQNRTCLDINDCGTIDDKPEEQQACEMPCIEDWTCGNWSECNNSLQSRTCTDDNQCGTIEDKPEEQQECEMPCVEDWECSVWSDCIDSLQTRVCVDFSYCDTIEDKPITEQACEMPCVEDWTCSDWTECDDSLQSRICIDDNQCSTIDDKPDEEQECEMPCIENWTCSKWSQCVDEIQTRTCADFNNCRTVDDKPEEEQECEIPNNSPVLEHINDTEIDENKVLDIWVEASDEDEDDDLTLTHNFTEYFQVAENYDYDTSIRRKYRWRPGSEDSGIYNVLFTVTDLRGAKDYEEIIITVNDIIENAAPEILPEIPDQEVEMNSDPWSIDLTDYETDDQDSGRDLRWKIIGGNKNLVQTSLNTNTDELKFYPIEDEFGETTIRLTLKDSDGKTDTQNVKVIINKIDNDHDYKINIGAKDINNDHINSRIELDGKQKYANPFAYFKMQFNQIIPFKVQSKDYTTKEGDYYFDEQVTSCTDSCSFTTNGYTTQCDKDNFQFRCECSVGGNNFDYVYVPPTEEFLLSEKLRKCSVACITDANCNDNKPDTKDFCIYPGKCNARCENEPCNVECKSNSGCDDNNASTKDICFLPKTCNSYCKHKPTSCNMECMSNDDCDDGRDDTYNLCRRARTCQAVCEFISIPNLKPDLVIEDFNVQTYFNKIVVVKFKIKNSGDTIAENVKWQLDTGGGLSNPQSSEDLTLRVDESAVVYSMGNYENSGSYTMVLTIDPDNLVKEKDESDNVDELGVSVS